MGIHYENYKRFSKGQGYVGVACRGVSPMASSKRWHAVDCQPCRETIVDRQVISRSGDIGTVECVEYRGAHILITSGAAMIERRVPWTEIDDDWAPLNIADIFGEAGDVE